MEKMIMQDSCDTCKEVLTVLSCFDESLIEKIPEKVFSNLSKLASSSTRNYSFQLDKKLAEQDISEDSKDLLALIYYDYIADSAEKIELQKIWNTNEKIYQSELEKKYNTNNIFRRRDVAKENSETRDLVVASEYKESFFQKIINKIKNICLRK